MFIFQLSDAFKVYALIYIVALIINGSYFKQINDFRPEIKRKFKINDSDTFISQNVKENIVTLSQSNYI